MGSRESEMAGKVLRSMLFDVVGGWSFGLEPGMRFVGPGGTDGTLHLVVRLALYDEDEAHAVAREPPESDTVALYYSAWTLLGEGTSHKNSSPACI